MKPISWAFLLLAAHSAFAPQLAAQELDLPRGAIRRLGSTDLRQDHVLSAAAETVELPIRTSRLAFSRDGRVAVAVAEDGFTMLVFDMKKLVK